MLSIRLNLILIFFFQRGEVNIFIVSRKYSNGKKIIVILILDII